jgi:hypothetical protein
MFELLDVTVLQNTVAAKYAQLMSSLLDYNYGVKFAASQPNQPPLPCRVLLDKLIKKFSAFYGTQRFITVFTTAHHFSSC